MIPQLLTATSLILVLGWAAIQLLIESSCYARKLDTAFTQITHSLHQKKRVRRRWICKKSISFVKKGSLRRSTGASFKVDLWLTGGIVEKK